MQQYSNSHVLQTSVPSDNQVLNRSVMSCCSVLLAPKNQHSRSSRTAEPFESIKATFLFSSMKKIVYYFIDSWEFLFYSPVSNHICKTQLDIVSKKVGGKEEGCKQ